ncbi:hypothetical protein [Luteimonas saliphila]|uniref:hypothetical protein n=1 Tax=Luteimonas saliphila TaxID=2804919 RepID=UPI00192DE005|nr:hypothetical protein [Luteimonas saliphila]
MPITRAKASLLLNQKEMALYDDSRINGLRQLDGKGLASRIKRARTARDRARDLVQKHKLASRARSGSKRGASGEANRRSKDKSELMADILKRFEGRLREVEREEKAAATPRRKSTATPARKAPAKEKATARKATAKRKPAAAGAKSAKKATSRKTASGSTARRQPADRETTDASATQRASGTGAGASKAKTKSAGKKLARKSRRVGRITPEQALAQTRALLEAKQARDHEPKPWEVPASSDPIAGTPGYQSEGAARRAKRLHAAEARIPAIQGSISTRDRVNQGKRDRRQGED